MGKKLEAGNVLETNQFLRSFLSNGHTSLLDLDAFFSGSRESGVFVCNSLDLSAPFVESLLQRVILGPVLVRDTIHPSPPHADLLETKVPNVVNDFKRGIGSGSNEVKRLPVIALLPRADGLRLFFDGLASRTNGAHKTTITGLYLILIRILGEGFDSLYDLRLKVLEFRLHSLFKLDKESFADALGLAFDLMVGNFFYTFLEVFGALISSLCELFLPCPEVLGDLLLDF